MPQVSAELPIAYSSFDDGYLWPWMVMAYSAITNANDTVEFAVANCNGLLSPDSVALVQRVTEALAIPCSIIDVEIDLEGVEYQWQFNVTVYARVALLDRLRREFVWLDADLLALPGWTDIFTESGDRPDGPDVVAFAVADRPRTIDQLRISDNLAYRAAGDRYFNTGVLRLRPDRWRELGMDHRWQPLARDHRRLGFVYPDQDILNYLLSDHASLLPRRLNHIVSELGDGSEVIRHFAGYPKPWRLSDRAKEYFVGLEVLNRRRESAQPSRGGVAWTFYERYWQYESDLIAALAANSHDLAAEALDRRARTELRLGRPDVLKYWLMRLAATPLRAALSEHLSPSFPRDRVR